MDICVGTKIASKVGNIWVKNCVQVSASFSSSSAPEVYNRRGQCQSQIFPACETLRTISMGYMGYMGYMGCMGCMGKSLTVTIRSHVCTHTKKEKKVVHTLGSLQIMS